MSVSTLATFTAATCSLDSLAAPPASFTTSASFTLGFTLATFTPVCRTGRVFLLKSASSISTSNNN